MKPWAIGAFCLLALPASAQQPVSVGTGAVLRGLDKVDGDVVDITLRNGKQVKIGRLNVELLECRYPQDNPSADAFALMTISDTSTNDELFKGWMMASSPALNALEHPRYDVWVLRCSTN